jgi:hypothetical protein
VIVIVGSPIGRPGASGVEAGGIAADVAKSIAGSGGSVQIVGRVGEDAAGDAVLLDLAAAGVGHVAVLREPTHSTPTAPPAPGTPASPDGPDLGESILADDGSDDGSDGGEASNPDPPGLSMDAADLELALRYLPDYRVIVLAADLEPEALDTVVGAAGWAGAQLVALVGADSGSVGLPPAATVLERPRSDPERAFAHVVAAYALALDQGREPQEAFGDAARSLGWAPATEG